MYLLSAVRHADAVTVASREIDAKTNEIGEFTRLLDQIDDVDLDGAVVTVDALHTQRGHADYLVTRRAHFVFAVKDNQPTLARRLRALPWTDVPVLHRSTARGHGREEQRLLKVVTVDSFPHARQVMPIQRKRRRIDTRRWHTQTVYAITDLHAHQASPDELATWARGHWTVEVRREALCFRMGVRDLHRLVVAAAG